MHELNDFEGLIQRFFVDKGLPVSSLLRLTMSIEEFALIARTQLHVADLDEFHGYCLDHAVNPPESIAANSGRMTDALEIVLNMAVRGTVERLGQSNMVSVDEEEVRRMHRKVAKIAGFVLGTGEDPLTMLRSDAERAFHRSQATGNAEFDFPGLFRQSGKTRMVGELYREVAEEAGGTLTRMFEGIAPTPAEIRAHSEAITRHFLGINPVITATIIATKAERGNTLFSTPKSRTDDPLWEGKLDFLKSSPGERKMIEAWGRETIYGPGEGLDVSHTVRDKMSEGSNGPFDWSGRPPSPDEAGFTLSIVRPGSLYLGPTSRQQFANDHQAPSKGKKGRVKMHATKNGAVYPKPRGW